MPGKILLEKHPAEPQSGLTRTCLESGKVIWFGPKTTRGKPDFARLARFARLALTPLRLVVYRCCYARRVLQLPAGAESGSGFRVPGSSLA